LTLTLPAIGGRNIPMLRHPILLSGLILSLGACKDPAPTAKDPAPAEDAVQVALTPEEERLEFERESRIYLSKLTAKHNEEWGLGKAVRWDADLEKGVISWTFADKVVSAPVQVIGTYVPGPQSLLWAWDHPSVSKDLAKDSLLLKQWGQEHRVSDLTTREINCSEAQVWTYTAMAAKLAGAQGAYRGPSGQAYIFFTFGDISIGDPVGTSDGPLLPE